MEFLTRTDINLLVFINQNLSHPYLDPFFIFLTSKSGAGVVAGILLAGALWFYPRVKFLLFSLILTVAISDQASSRFLKKIFKKPRPCVTHQEKLRLPLGVKKSPSFPSSHAANSFSAATFLGFHFKTFAPQFFLIAFLVSYSRLYLGVHYPSDVLFGAVLGILLALMVLKLRGDYPQQTPKNIDKIKNIEVIEKLEEIEVEKRPPPA